MSGQDRSSTAIILAGAGAFGLTVGIGSLAVSPQGRAKIASVAGGMAVATGIKRQRLPQPGDYWSGCNVARAAGTTPIYRGEAGYRPEMDGDADGVACEPRRT